MIRSLAVTLLLATAFPRLALADELYHVNNLNQYSVWLEVKEQNVDANRVGFCTNPFSGNQKWLKHSEGRKGPNAGVVSINLEHSDCRHPVIWTREYRSLHARNFTVSGSPPNDIHVASH